MRRVVCVILFVFGGYLLTGELMMAWLDIGQGAAVQVAVVAIMAAFAAPFLLLGTWASPGNRLAELGLTLMISAGAGAFTALAMFAVLRDPGFKRLMPPDQPLPDLHFAPVFGIVNLLVIAGAGFALRRWAVERAPRRTPELERVFGDE